MKSALPQLKGHGAVAVGPSGSSLNSLAGLASVGPRPTCLQNKPYRGLHIGMWCVCLHAWTLQRQGREDVPVRMIETIHFDIIFHSCIFLSTDELYIIL